MSMRGSSLATRPGYCCRRSQRLPSPNFLPVFARQSRATRRRCRSTPPQVISIITTPRAIDFSRCAAISTVWAVERARYGRIIITDTESARIAYVLNRVAILLASPLLVVHGVKLTGVPFEAARYRWRFRMLTTLWKYCASLVSYECTCPVGSVGKL
jgi:hypothetical protein